jgi:hypothetical protein
MKIGITIDGVVRDFITKFESVYDKYYPVELEEGEEPLKRDIKDLDLLKWFKFTGGTKELNEFMYVDSSLEIFGHAGN